MIELAKLFRLYIIQKRKFDNAAPGQRERELIALKRAEREVLNLVKQILKISDINDEPNL